VLLFLKLEPADVIGTELRYRDVSKIGHFGTGNAEFTLEGIDEVREVEPFIQLSLEKVGGV
jgi:predicted transport protein